MEKVKSIKSKVALFIGYNGCSFKGLQFQRDTDNTVENLLHKVLCQQGFILATNADNLRRIKWSRAGRTDKKVHALCNGISLNLELGERYQLGEERQFDVEKVARDINADLPPDVRILAAKKAGKSFDMRHDACSRIYNYIAPLRLFLTKEQFLNKTVLNQIERDELVARLNELAQQYLGTHSYHNFTKGYKPNDKRSDRFITRMSVELLESEVVEKALAQLYPTEK
jgi:tRNA pseudouridine38-40 synthase